MQLSISVVLYNTKYNLLLKIIHSILSSDFQDYIITIVDNSEQKAEYIDEILQLNKNKIEYIKTDKNNGYGYGHNIAIQKYINISKYHLVINPDVIFDKHLLSNLISKMNKDPEIAISSVATLNDDNSIQYVHRTSPNLLLFLLRFFEKKIIKFKFIKNILHKHEMRSFYDQEVFHPDVISGCFMFINNHYLKKIEKFDEKYFMYCEDFDLSRRLSKYGKITVFVDLFVHHSWARESKKSFRMFLIHLKSIFRFVSKKF